MPLTITQSSRVVVVNGGIGTVTTNTWAIARIRWVSKTALAGDTCLLTDTAGGTIFESNATGADWSDETDLSKTPPVLGVKVSTLASGNVYIYLR